MASVPLKVKVFKNATNTEYRIPIFANLCILPKFIDEDNNDTKRVNFCNTGRISKQNRATSNRNIQWLENMWIDMTWASA